jgi:hypothetical protein
LKTLHFHQDAVAPQPAAPFMVQHSQFVAQRSSRVRSNRNRTSSPPPVRATRSKIALVKN